MDAMSIKYLRRFSNGYNSRRYPNGKWYLGILSVKVVQYLYWQKAKICNLGKNKTYQIKL